jgi:hypothetical protein
MNLDDLTVGEKYLFTAHHECELPICGYPIEFVAEVRATEFEGSPMLILKIGGHRYLTLPADPQIVNVRNIPEDLPEGVDIIRRRV